MSTDIVACPRCGANLQNNPAVAGQLVACPQCQTQLQMPQLSATPASVDHLLPPTAQLPPETTYPGAVGIEPATKGRKKSATQRLRRKPNYGGPLIAIAILVALVAVGIAIVIQQRNNAAVQDAHQRIIGNWELADPSDQLERWEFAFHTDGRFQMLVQATGQQQANANPQCRSSAANDRNFRN